MPTYDLWLYMLPKVKANSIQNTMKSMFNAVGDRIVIRKVENYGIRHPMYKMKRHQHISNDCRMLKMTIDMNGYQTRYVDKYLKEDDSVLRWQMFRVNEPKVKKEDVRLPKRNISDVMDHFNKMSPTEFPTRKQLEEMRSVDPHEASIEELERSLQIGLPVRKLQMEMWLNRAEELANVRSHDFEYSDVAMPASLSADLHAEQMSELEHKLAECVTLDNLQEIMNEFAEFRQQTIEVHQSDASFSPVLRDWFLQFADKLQARFDEVEEAEQALMRSEYLFDEAVRKTREVTSREIEASAAAGVYEKQRQEQPDTPSQDAGSFTFADDLFDFGESASPLAADRDHDKDKDNKLPPLEHDIFGVL